MWFKALKQVGGIVAALAWLAAIYVVPKELDDEFHIGTGWRFFASAALIGIVAAVWYLSWRRLWTIRVRARQRLIDEDIPPRGFSPETAGVLRRIAEQVVPGMSRYRRRNRVVLAAGLAAKLMHFRYLELQISQFIQRLETLQHEMKSEVYFSRKGGGVKIIFSRASILSRDMGNFCRTLPPWTDLLDQIKEVGQPILTVLADVARKVDEVAVDLEGIERQLPDLRPDADELDRLQRRFNSLMDAVSESIGRYKEVIAQLQESQRHCRGLVQFLPI